MKQVAALPQSRPVDDERVLLDRARAGDAHAREVLVGRYLDDVYALAVRITGDRDLGADAAQDAMLNALRGLGSFRGEASLRTWLLRITANTARTLLRRRGRRREVALELVDMHADPGADPADLTASRAEAERALGLLAQLPPKQRETVALRTTAGMEYSEIARIMGCSEGAARVNYHHGMKRLRELMR